MKRVFIIIVSGYAGAIQANVAIGDFTITQTEHAIDKQFIRQRLAWIMSSKHDANPSRSTLQSVNAFLMD